MTSINGGAPGFRALVGDLAQHPITTEQRDQLKKIAPTLVDALDRRELNADVLKQLGVPPNLFGQLVLEMFVTKYPGLVRPQLQENAAAFAKAITEAPKLSPEAAALERFDKVLAQDLRRGNMGFPEGGKVAKADRYKDLGGGVSQTLNELKLTAYSGGRDYDFFLRHDVSSGELSFGYNYSSSQSSSSGHGQLSELTEQGLANVTAALERYVQAENLRLAEKGGEMAAWPAYVRDTVLPGVRALTMGDKVDKLKATVKAAIPEEPRRQPAAQARAADEAKVKRAVGDAFGDGQTVGRVPKGFLAQLVAKIF